MFGRSASYLVLSVLVALLLGALAGGMPTASVRADLQPTATPVPRGEVERGNSAQSGPLLDPTGRGFIAEGFTAIYYNVADLVDFAFVTPYTPPIDFYKSCFGEIYPFPSCELDSRLVDGNDYSVRWLGKLHVPTTGSYTFTMTVDDGVRFYVDRRPIADSGWYWPQPDHRPPPQTIALTAGRHPIMIEYEQRVSYVAALQLRWSGPGFEEEVIPLYIEAPPAEVAIDIKPGSDPNSINCRNQRGVIPVAILTTESFDALTVDHATVTFEGANEIHVDQGSGIPRRHEEDVDGDGDIDLIFHFRLGDTSLSCDRTEATLSGETFDGQLIEGTDSVNMIDPGG